ncbi:MAG: site-specific tyrosine recombinase/integron integrase [Opitutales bacterium]|nr:site-specific tyrosine recombinase/integron integrase [Opitutales bacterium]
MDNFASTLLDYKAHLQMQLGLSKNSVLSYVEDISLFGEFLKTHGKKSFESVDLDDIYLWIDSISSKVRSTTQARKLSALKSFSLFMVDEKRWPNDYTQKIVRPKVKRVVPSALTLEEVERLLSTPSTNTYEGARDSAMFELMYSSGLRVSELCSLKGTDINFDENFLRIKGKGSKVRLVPFGKDARDKLVDYIRNIRCTVKNIKSDVLFITKRGTPLSRKTFWGNIKKYAAQCGIEKNVKPHILRHSFATHLLRNGANLLSIQEMLGHSDLSTTQIYTELTKDTLLDEFAKRHPRDNMKL